MNFSFRFAFAGRPFATALLLSLLSILRAGALEKVPDFTFLQASDIHTPMEQSAQTIARIHGLDQIVLQPFDLKVAKPGFVILTGDLTEFGGGNGSWKTFRDYWTNCDIPIYPILGNHDNTWHANIKLLRESGFGPYYSSDTNGCHFVGLMTATAQDPRPSIGEEEIVWLKKDLEKVSAKTPVFVYFHHPLGGPEFASRYDWDRLLDVLRSHNTALLMAGHTHGHISGPIEGIDQITGGSTFGGSAGFAVISVKDGMLRASYWKNGQPTPDEKLIEKPLAANSSYPDIALASPAPRASCSSNLTIDANLSAPMPISKATFTIDDEVTGDLEISGASPAWKASGNKDIGELLPGAHCLRVEFISGARHYSRSTQFFFDPANRPAAWRAYLAASSKVTPTIAQGVVYVGANDGRLHAFRATDGKELWSVDTGAEILAQPLVADGKIYNANGMGQVAAYTTAGKKVWSFTAGDAVYSSPVLAAGKVVFGCNDGKLYALDAATGKQVWVNTDGTYTIESTPFVANGKIYYGAWDEYVRCVDANNGRLLWKQIAEGVRAAKSAKRYYSPADAMPVVAEGKLMIADRNFMLTILNAESGQPAGSRRGVSATGISEDGKFVYLRQNNGSLVKIDPAGAEIWSVRAHVGVIPTAPIEKNGVVYVSSGKGTVSAIAANDGKILWQHQASPQLYVMSSVSCDGTNAYVTAFDGTLTAIHCKQ